MTSGADKPEDREYANWFLSLSDREQYLIIRQLERVEREAVEKAASVAEHARHAFGDVIHIRNRIAAAIRALIQADTPQSNNPQ